MTMEHLAFTSIETDVLIMAGPRTSLVGSFSVEAASKKITKVGLKTSWINGQDLRARGVIPRPLSGGATVYAEDLQKRFYRIKTRALICYQQTSSFSDPFQGSYSEGLIPIQTFERLSQEYASWISGQTILILGAGQRAIQLGKKILRDKQFKSVICLAGSQDIEKNEAAWEVAWEVERRSFEMMGGVILFQKPQSIKKISSFLWEVMTDQKEGFQVNAVISAGGFDQKRFTFDEYPEGSLLYTLQQTARSTRESDVLGWDLEHYGSQWVASEIIKSLMSDLTVDRQWIQQESKQTKFKLKKMREYLERPFVIQQEGKWLSPTTVTLFSQQKSPAVLECFEEISCNLCESHCPEKAIELHRDPLQNMVKAQACTSCGECIKVCPSQIPVVFSDPVSKQHKMSDKKSEPSLGHGAMIFLTVYNRFHEKWKTGELVQLKNRKFETLASGRVVEFNEEDPLLVKVEVPSHLKNEIRTIRKLNDLDHEKNHDLTTAVSFDQEVRVEVLLNGEKRLLRSKTNLVQALYENGRARVQDSLYCKDGSCGLCEVHVDGEKQLACQTKIRKGMVIQLKSLASQKEEPTLCYCLGLTTDQAQEEIKKGNQQIVQCFQSGKCHGQLCGDVFERWAQAQGVVFEKNWQFPWTDWKIKL